ncbi:uncharacterized protein PFLUO_LOCUS112 [Penicillium psychrofluorescens]|uniref:uncharacterized protein n=1 Tax=Penicillium psychrofluorescens TaxID=3158075 RepID=UPI003CCD521B
MSFYYPDASPEKPTCEFDNGDLSHQRPTPGTTSELIIMQLFKAAPYVNAEFSDEDK